MQPECFLAEFSDVPCRGRLVRAHLIPKQRLRRELRKYDFGYDGLDVVFWDPRVWVPACGGLTGLSGHHGLLDSKQIAIPRSALPKGLEQFAEEYGLGWSLDRDFGLREAVS